MSDDRLVLHGSFTSSSSYKPMLFLALSGLPFSFRTVNLKNGVQKEAAHLAINRYGQVPVLRHRGLTIVMSNVILDYLARATGPFRAEDGTAPLAGARVALLGERRDHQRGARSSLRPLPPRCLIRDRELLPAPGRSRARFCRQVARRSRVAGGRCLLDRRYRLLGSHGVRGGGRPVARLRARTSPPGAIV